MSPALFGHVALTSILCVVFAGPCGALFANGPAPGGLVPAGGTHASAVSLRAAAAGQAPKKSIWDGVFSDEQAERGRQTVARKCGYCHGDDLGGGDDPPGPALKGRNFLDEWYGKNVAELFVRISETMPHDAPGSLSQETYAEVLSFILKENGFPAGPKALPASAPELDILVNRKP